MKGPLFYSKILLFGEYGIIKNSKGLSIPYNFYNGALKVDKNPDEAAVESNRSLARFAVYLEKLQKDNPDLVQFDIAALTEDVKSGMYFDSTIPQGYGVGNSGALVASIYDKYAFGKITVLENLTREKLLKLKRIFGEMESFFHGKSSGLDPLNSYLSLPILINSKDDIEPAGIPSQTVDGKGAVFLLDSGSVGETAPMVNIFMENMKQEGFRKMIKNQFIKHTDACVEDFLKGDVQSLFGNVKQLSKTVLRNFKPMIPASFHDLWKQVNWLPQYNEEELLVELKQFKKELAKQNISKWSPFDLPKRLWKSLVDAAGIFAELKWADATADDILKLGQQLNSGIFQVNGKSTFKEEFVTAGGVDLKEIDFKTFAAKRFEGLYLVGEILNVDAVTGGFNFQNAWTSGYLAAQDLAEKFES